MAVFTSSPRCSSVCSNHINIPQRCSHQGDPTPTGWLLSSPDLPATAYTAAHSGCCLGSCPRWPFPLLPCTFCLASLPHLSFLQCSRPQVSSLPMSASQHAASSPVLCKVLPPALSRPLKPELWAPLSNSPIQYPL